MVQTIHTVVFEEKPGGGNPCPVTLHAEELSTEEMQAMAKEFGEECVFLMRPDREDCDIRVRYFVPLHEMEMCMHATIGSATVLVEKGIFTKSPIVYETALGPVRVEWERGKKGVEVCVEQFLPKESKENPSPQEVCRALRIPEEELGEGPVCSAATSRFKLMVPLASKKAVYGLDPDYEALWDVCDRYNTTGFYPFAIEKENGETVIYARQFPNRSGYLEDPATGVAASALGAYLTLHQLLPVHEGWNSYTIRQGEAMGRPSIIGSDILVEEGKITRTRVRGTAHLV